MTEAYKDLITEVAYTRRGVQVHIEGRRTKGAISLGAGAGVFKESDEEDNATQ